MKKLFTLALFVSVFSMAAMAQSKEFSSGQLSLRNSIQTYLQNEGFQPSIDSDGDIKFKRQGDTYYVIVSATDENPYYIQLAKYFNYGTKVTKTKLSLYATEVNYKMCKIVPLSDSYKLNAEMYLTSSTAFTSIFYKILSVLDGIEGEIADL